MENIDNNITQNVYEGIIFNGRYTTSEILEHLHGQKNKYGEWREAEVIVKGSFAETICKHIKGADGIVARGIAIGIELGKPTFDVYGEEFLERHIANYKKSNLGVALSKILLDGLNSDRCSKIIAGVQNILDQKGNYTDEEKIAIYAIKVYDVTNKFKGQKSATRSTILLKRIFEEYEQSGILKMPEVYDKCLNLPSEKDIIKRNPIRKEELENSYKYFLKHYDEISTNFTAPLSDYSQNEIVAFYVASREEDELHRLYEMNKERE